MKINHFIIVLLLSIGGFAQDGKIDSLKNIVSKRQPDSIAVRRLFDISNQYFRRRDSKNALLYADKAGDMAKQIDDKILYAESLMAKGNIAMVLNGNYPQSLHYAFEELKIYETLKDSTRLAIGYANISGSYDEIGDLDSSIKYALKALAYSKNSGIIEKVNINNSVGYGYVQKQNPRLALPYFQKANSLALQMKTDDFSQLAFSFYGMGKSNRLLGNQALALAYYHKSVAEAKRQAGKGVTFWSDFILQLAHIGLAEIYESRKMKDSALYYYRRSLEAKYAKNKLALDAYRKLAVLTETSNVSQSLGFYKEYIRLNDSLYSDKRTKEVHNLTFNEQERQRELAEKQRLEEEERRHHLQYAAIAIIITIFLGLLIMLSHSVTIGEKWLKVLGIIGLLLTFEFINLLIHPYIAHLTHHSPVQMLLIMVAIAAMLVPLHHRIEHWATHKMLEKNKQVKLAAAKKIIESQTIDTSEENNP